MINFDVCKIRGKLSQVIRKVLSSKNYLGTLVRAIFQLNEWRKFVKLDNTTLEIFSFSFFCGDSTSGEVLVKRFCFEHLCLHAVIVKNE